MNTLNTYPNSPVTSNSDRSDLLASPESFRRALVGLAILVIGFGLMLLASLLQQKSSTNQPDHLELPLPMPAGDLMAQSPTGTT